MRTPAVLLAAPASGSGKTAAACALMAALKSKGKKVKACKCGPDYIDPMFHREVLGVESRNLDLFFSSRAELADGFCRHTEDADIAVVEGVMGYYDGMALETDRASSYDVAKTLGIPVILVLPCRGAALSLAAVVKGMAEYRKDSNIRGILLNRVPATLYPRLKEMLETELRKMGRPIPVLGYLPEEEAFSLKSRHLGLVTPQETEHLKEQMERAGEILSRTADLEQICRIASAAVTAGADREKPAAAIKREHAPVIGVAQDDAFCFYYKDNLELLKSLGCSLVPFSPLSDRRLPEGLGGILLGGGYPELYAGRLSGNRGMLESVREALESGMPCLAECGGFLYLHEELKDSEGRAYPMAGAVKGHAFPAGKLVRFGYVQIRAGRQGSGDPYLSGGETIRGHEFHYWDSTDVGSDCLAVKPDGRRKWSCIHARGNLFAGYPHLYLPSLPAFARRFADRCETWQERRGQRG